MRRATRGTDIPGAAPEATVAPPLAPPLTTELYPITRRGGRGAETETGVWERRAGAQDLPHRGSGCVRCSVCLFLSVFPPSLPPPPPPHVARRKPINSTPGRS